MPSKRTRALMISKAVKDKVYGRDGGRCIFCCKPGLPEAHYISRAHGGLGIEENVVTACRLCHDLMDNSSERPFMLAHAREYLKAQYPGWDESKLIYKKGGT